MTTTLDAARSRPSSSAPRRTATPALVALAGAAFAFVTSETLPVGLLPQITADLDVSTGTAGQLLTWYALVAALTAIPFTAWTTRVPRHRLMLLVVALFVVSQAAAALAPGYLWLVGARLVGALAHGVFWSVLAPIAARLVPPGAAGKATGLVFTGNSLALVAGLPLGTLLGQALGWRAAFALTGAAGLATLVALWRLLPALTGDDDGGLSRALLRRVARPRLVALYVVTASMAIGQFAAYSYLAPLVAEHGGFTGADYGALLLGYGGAGLLGVLVSARLVDRHPGPTFATLLVVLVLALGALAVVGRAPVVTAIAVVAWGGAFTALPVLLQSAVLRVAPAVADVASAVYVVAFQIGIGGGAWLGGALVDSGHLDVTTLVAVGGGVLALVVGLAVSGLFPRSASGDHRPAVAPAPTA